MDKYEYRVRAEQIKSLLANKEYAEAMMVANTIDWKRVKSISMLCTVSEIYKINRKYEESRDILLLAYDRYPNGRMIVYALCELAIKMEEFVHAVEYYKEFLQIAPKDTGRYILQYKLYEAQDVSLEERIAVLEEFKRKDYREKWAYELAYLYHRIGLGTKCVEECDELILWFGEGKYVTKAMELKMLHEPLSPGQLEKYEKRNTEREESQFFDETDADDANKEVISIQIKSINPSHEPTIEIPAKKVEEEIKIKPVNLDKFSTVNLQEALAQSMQEIFGDEVSGTEDEISEAGKFTFGEYEGEEEVFQVTEEKEADDYEESENDSYLNPVKEEKMDSPAVEEIYATQEEPEAPILSKKEMERILSQDGDGQIRLCVPESSLIEKQITGQMNLKDVLSEWEKMKIENDRRRLEAAKRRSLEQTKDIMSQLSGVIPGIQVPEVIAVEDDYEDEITEIYSEPASTAQESFEEESLVKTEYPVKTEFPVKTESPVIIEAPAIEEPVAEPEKEPFVAKEPSPSVEISEPSQKAGKAVIRIERKKVDGKGRELNETELELFSGFIAMSGMKEQLGSVLQQIDMRAVTGNVVITGNETSARIKLALALAKAVQLSDPDFTGKVAKITASMLNNKDIEKSLKALSGGALIIEKAGDLTIATLDSIAKVIRKPENRLLMIMEDSKAEIKKITKLRNYVSGVFNISIHVPTYTNHDLVAHARKYALDREYTIDDMGVLALYTRIDELQTSEHAVSMKEVEEIMDAAIKNVDKKNMGHLVDVLFAKRYNEDDLIILKEKDFIKKK